MNLKAFLPVILGFCVGCTAKYAAAPEQEPRFPDYLEHRVEYSGETLGSIARWYTGSTSNWGKIQSANPEIRPNRIRVGMIIRIPNDLVTRSEKMPPPARSERAADKGPAAVTSPVDSSVTTSTTYTESVVSIGDEDAAPPTAPPSEITADSSTLNATDAPTYEAPPEVPSNSYPEQTPPAQESGSGVGSFLGALGKALAPSREGSSGSN